MPRSEFGAPGRARAGGGGSNVRVFRFADWSLSPDTSGSGPIFVSECTTCGLASESADEPEGPEIWCLKHAGLTGHTGYRNIITCFSRAALLEGPS